MKKLLHTLLISFIFITGISITAFAVQRQAIKSGNWNDPSIWSPAGVPQAGDDVVNSGYSGQFTVTITGIVSCRNLNVSYGGIVKFVGNTTLNNSGIFNIDSYGSTIYLTAPSGNEVHIFNGEITNYGEWINDGGNMQCGKPNPIILNNYGNIYFNAPGTVVSNIAIRNLMGWNGYYYTYSTTHSPINGNVTIYKGSTAGYQSVAYGSFITRGGGSFTISDTIKNDGQLNGNGSFIINNMLAGQGYFGGNNFIIGPSGTIFPTPDYNSLPQCYHFTKNLTLNGTYKNKIFDDAPPCQNYNYNSYGIIRVSDTLFLNGKLEVDMLFQYPRNGQVLTIMYSRVLVGTFSNISPALPSGWSVRYNYPAKGNVSLEYISCNRPTVSITPDYTFNCSPQPVTLTANTNATSPTYTWSTGQTTKSITVNPASTTTYTVTIGSGPCAATASTTVTVNPPINVSVSKTDPVCAGVSTGTATANVSGGTSPYTYSWSNGETTQTISNLKAGTYHVTVYDDNFCGESASVTITDPPSITLATSKMDATCNTNNGSATVTATNGTAPYTYLWSNGATTQTVNNLSAGNFSVTVTDAKGCTKSANVTVASASTTVLTTSSTNESCSGGNNGSATVTASGGTSPYTYLWSNGATTSTINNLSAGTYTVTVTDASGCSKTASVTITAPPVLTLTANSTNVSCNDGNNGSATVSVSGGTSPYTYAWSNGATTSSINNLSAGTYNVTVTDGNGCTKTSSVTITAPAAIIVNTTSSNVSCNGGNNGSATATASGGTSPYTYAWSNGATTQAINNLSAGTYTVTVTDAKACTKSASVIITDPSSIALTTSTMAATCGANNGSVTVTATNGTAPYTYLWSNGATTQTVNNLSAGNYSVTVTDAKGCNKSANVTISSASTTVLTSSSTNVSCSGGNNGSATVTASGGTSPYTYLWSNGAITSTINNLSAGTYTVTVTDASGCSKTGGVTITAPPPLTLTTTSTNVSCNAGNNGAATANVSGGTSPYTYSWSNGATTSTINNLSAGTYNVTTTDANGCTKTSSVTITSPSAILINTTSTNVSCTGGNNGTVTANALGGTSPLTYAWSNGATTSTINNLSAGTYNVTVTDANGCVKTASVSITQPAAIVVNSTSTNISCNGANNGSATVTPSGGTSPYTYSWSNGTTSSTINNLSAGTYNVTVTDAAGCTKTAGVTITEPAAITVNATSTNVTCGGSSNGSAIVTATGGTSPYTYLWSNGATTSTINNLSAGNYNVTVTDVNGCTRSTSVTITSPLPITHTANSTNVTCNGGNNGSAIVIATGGTSPYTYLWSNGATTSTINNLAAGTFNVTVTDARGCTKTASITITAPSAITLNTSSTNISCSGGNNGSATVTATGGTSPYTYSWSNGATTQTINNIPAGTYNVTVTDASGCTKTTNVTLTPGPALSINLGPDRTLCFGQTVTLDGTNNFPGVLYKWTSTNGFSASSPSVVVSNTGSYYLEVSTPSGCIAKDTVNITATTDPISSDFIMASQGYKDSLVNSINIALPVPDSVEWIIPSNPNISVLSKSKQKAEFKFLQLGTYSIGMKAYRGQCFSITNKQIVVLQGTVFTTPARREPLIKQFNILPNPNNGQFTVKVALRENTDIRLRVIEFVTGNIINDRSLKGAKDYNEAYTLTVAPGTYSIILETAKESRTQKIVIQ